MKACSHCKQKKLLSEFYKRKPTKKDPKWRYNSWCKSCIRVKDRKRYWDNPEEAKEKARKWAKKNPDKVKEIRKKVNQKRKLEVLKHYGNKCTCCKETNPVFLCIDHIENDGARHRKKLKRGSGTNFYEWIKKNNYPKGLQVLCFNCNMAKAFLGLCPHQKI